MTVTAFRDVFREYDRVSERLADLGPAGDCPSTVDQYDALTVEQYALAMEIVQLDGDDAETLLYQAKVLLDFDSGEQGVSDLAARALARRVLQNAESEK